ncbi:hypothetical protein HJFPF1_06972 [Paramyrothecium foliicola]|nr:hypothetical protein HJFPF1_06972 [Paramyrothecium foliicola]
MLDENLPTYSFRQSSENPLHTILYFTHNGSNPSAEYLLKRPSPSASQNQYALGLMDAQYTSVIYGEVLLKPEWTQPTLSAAEIRAQNGNAPAIPVMPEAFAVSLYNPDQVVAVKRNQGSWKSDSWEFEIPEQTFKQPSASRIDRDSDEQQTPDLVPKVMFRWKRDGRLSRDMTCYLCGRSVNGKKNKEPDITVALFRGGKNDSTITIYEPNMARVDVEDRKGLEVVFLLSAEVIRDLYLNPKQDPFNTSGGASAAGVRPSSRGRRRTNSRPGGSPTGVPAMSGALNSAGPSSPPRTSPTGGPSAGPSAGRDGRKQAEIEAETKRLQAMVAEEERQARERRDQEEQQRIKQMLDQEEQESRRRREAEIEAETERLRREYGVQQQPTPPAPAGSTSPALPPRPAQGGGWFGPPSGPAPPQQPPRPVSMSSAQMENWHHNSQPPAQAPQQQQQNGGGSSGRKKLGKLFQGPYAGPAGASVSGFFGGGSSSNNNNRADEERRKKVQKKRSVHF